MSSEPSVSVLLAAHGVPTPHFEQALASMLFQTRKPNEVVLVDDSGCAAYKRLSYEILATGDSGIKLRYIENPQNLGLVRSLNEGLREASGDIIFRMDADDIALPHRIESQLSFFKKGFDIVGGQIIRFGTGGFKLVRYPSNMFGVFLAMLKSCPFAHPAVAYRRAVILRVGGYRQVTHAEDLDLWIRCLAANLKMTNVPLPILLYREHANQVSIRYSHEQRRQSRQIRKEVPAAIFRRLFADS